jgi:hypothetical protein
MQKRLIEYDLPLADIAEESASEYIFCLACKLKRPQL